MIHYRIYLLNEAGHVFQGLDCEVADDLEALELAMPLSRDRPVEIWQAKRCVAKLQKGDEAMLADEPVAAPELRAASG